MGETPAYRRKRCARGLHNTSCPRDCPEKKARRAAFAEQYVREIVDRAGDLSPAQFETLRALLPPPGQADPQSAAS